MNKEDKEDNFIFYMEDIDLEFAMVWSNTVQSPQLADSRDVRLECSDGRYLHAHQNLLSISSDCLREAFHYYSAKCTDNLSPDEELVIGLPEMVPFEELESVMDYIYKGFVKVPESRVTGFLEVAKFLAVKGLSRIKPVFVDLEFDNIIEMLIDNQFGRRTDAFEEPKSEMAYDFHLKDTDEECDDRIEYFSDSSSADLPCGAFTAINPTEPKVESLIFGTDDKIKVESGLFVGALKAKRIGLQGRKPQVGSPLITEEFKIDNRYQCKVCFRSYQWKKSLVRHYKDLHPNNVPKVTE